MARCIGTFRSLLVGVAALVFCALTPATPSSIYGTVRSHGTNGIVIETDDGQRYNVRVTDKTIIEYLQKPLKAEQLAVGSFILVTGFEAPDKTINATRIQPTPRGAL